MSNVLEEMMNELLDAGLTGEQLKLAQYFMAQYAIASLMDSSIGREAENICTEYEAEQQTV